MNILSKVLIVYLVLINAAGLAVMYSDKRRAKENRWRIPEATLLLTAAVGGSVGCIAGMLLFRHKTRHAKFVIGFPLILLLQLALAFGIVWHCTDFFARLKEALL